MAELADALDLGSSVPDVKVQVLSGAPKNKVSHKWGFVFLFNQKDLNLKEARALRKQYGVLFLAECCEALAEQVQMRSICVLSGAT